jgi:hypothetical protein
MKNELQSYFTWRSAVMDSDLPSITRHILLTLSTYMNDHGDAVYPSLKTLENKTGLSRKTIIKHLNFANEKEFLVTSKKSYKGNTWKQNEYRMRFPKGGVYEGATESKVVELGDASGGTQGTHLVEELHTNSNRNSKTNSKYMSNEDKGTTNDKPKRKTSITTKFGEVKRLPDKYRQIATDKGMHESWHEFEWGLFCDHWDGGGKTWLNWTAVWRSWVTKAINWDKSKCSDKNMQSNETSGSTTLDAANELMAIMRDQGEPQFDLE